MKFHSKPPRNSNGLQVKFYQNLVTFTENPLDLCKISPDFSKVEKAVRKCSVKNFTQKIGWFLMKFFRIYSIDLFTSRSQQQSKQLLTRIIYWWIDLLETENDLCHPENKKKLIARRLGDLKIETVKRSEKKFREKREKFPKRKAKFSDFKQLHLEKRKRNFKRINYWETPGQSIRRA